MKEFIIILTIIITWITLLISLDSIKKDPKRFKESKVYYEYNIYHECVIDPKSKAIIMCKCDTIPCDTIYIPIK
jgi:hypothetical protein